MTTGLDGIALASQMKSSMFVPHLSQMILGIIMCKRETRYVDLNLQGLSRTEKVGIDNHRSQLTCEKVIASVDVGGGSAIDKERINSQLHFCVKR